MSTVAEQLPADEVDPAPVRWRLPTLADRFDPRDNAIGFVRLGLAAAVVFAHCWPIGFGKPSLGVRLTHHQLDIGSAAVYGFFVLSGFLVTSSAVRTGAVRFCWHRFLRIFPGLWLCLAVTAVAIGPLIALAERGTTRGYWSAATGPWTYVTANLSATIHSPELAGLLGTAPIARLNPGAMPAVNPSLWTLQYEVACYAVLAVLTFTGVLVRTSRLIPVLAFLGYLVIVADYLSVPGRASLPPPGIATRELPVFGMYSLGILLYFGFCFLLGATAWLYRDRIPMHLALAVPAALLFVASLLIGGAFVVGLPALTYLVLYAGVTLPGPVRRIGRRHDYSYGVYLYGAPVQHLLAVSGVAAYGAVAYFGASLAGAGLLAVLSWHLVERRAMRLKNMAAPAWVRELRSG